VARLICSSSTIICTGSQAGVPVGFSVARGTGVLSGGAEVATVRDNQPILNVGSFGACKLSSPAKPCVPVLSDFKDGVPKVLVGGSPALTESSTLRCKQGGVISFRHPGQSSVEVS
jgi:uncharacterized protein DUF4280